MLYVYEQSVSVIVAKLF